MATVRKVSIGNFCFVFLLAVAFVPFISAEAAPKRYSYGDDTQTAIREMRDSLEDLRHIMGNQETELRMVKDKILNQDNTVETLRQQMTDTHNAQKDQLKGNATSIESKMAQLEAVNKSLSADLKVLKEHINENSKSLDQQNHRLSKLEKGFEQIAQNVHNLDIAVHTLVEAMQVKATSLSTPNGNSKSYKVKPGDSLGKIAQDHQVSLKVLRDLNPQISNDKIIVGQNIQLPSS